MEANSGWLPETLKQKLSVSPVPGMDATNCWHFGDAAWFEPEGFPLPIQTSRVLLYSGYFFAGVGIGATNLRTGLLAEGGEVAKRWGVWLGSAMICYGGILFLVYAHHNWVADFNAPPLWWRADCS